MIAEHLLDRVAQVHKSYNPAGVAGGHGYEDVASFSWPCRLQSVNPTAHAQATGRFLYEEWRMYGNVPTEGEIEPGDKLVLEDDTVFRVTSRATHTGPRGHYLALTVARS